VVPFAGKNMLALALSTMACLETSSDNLGSACPKGLALVSDVALYQQEGTLLKA